MGFPIGDDDQHLLHILLDAAAVFLREQDLCVIESPGSVGITTGVPAPPQILNDAWSVWMCIEVEENLRLVRVPDSSKLNSVPTNISFIHQMDSQINHAFLLLWIYAAWVIQHEHNVQQSDIFTIWKKKEAGITNFPQGILHRQLRRGAN